MLRKLIEGSKNGIPAKWCFSEDVSRYLILYRGHEKRKGKKVREGKEYQQVFLPLMTKKLRIPVNHS